MSDKLCSLCGNLKKDGKFVVKDPSTEHIDSLITTAKLLVNSGYTEYASFVQYASGCSKEEKKNIQYHRTCRQQIMKRRINDSSKGTNIPDLCGPAKIGRPGGTVSDETPTRKSLRDPDAAPKFKEVKCVFAPAFCKWEGRAALHQVLSDNRGQELINIKNATNNDAVHAALSLLPDDKPRKAALYELHYHNNCLRNAHRTCKSPQNVCHNGLVESLCDLEILIHLQSCMSNEPFRTDMSSLNTKYMEIRKNNNARPKSERQHKHLKSLINTNLPEVEFTKLPDMRKSQELHHSKKVGEAVDLAISFDFDGLGETMNICSLDKNLRNELLDYRNKWSFTGDLTKGYEKPPLISFFLKMLLFGENAGTSERLSQIESTVDSVGQLLLFNTATNRQVKYKPKAENSVFRHSADVTLTIGLLLSIHQLERNESLVTFISKLHLGVNIDYIRNLYDRAHTADLERMKVTGGFC